MAKITVQNTPATVVKINETDYISITDIARYKTDDTNAVIGNWIRNPSPCPRKNGYPQLMPWD